MAFKTAIFLILLLRVKVEVCWPYNDVQYKNHILNIFSKNIFKKTLMRVKFGMTSNEILRHVALNIDHSVTYMYTFM